MNSKTLNPVAFDSVALAVGSIEKYNSSKDTDNLVEAEIALQTARRADPDYLDALFYSGLTLDLIGRPKDAAPFFERIYNEIDRESIKEEAQYNLGVAYYHRYSHQYLAEAEKNFLGVIKKTHDSTLKNLAKANLAQTYAMWMIPGSDEKKSWRENAQVRPGLMQFIEGKYAQFQKYDRQVRHYLVLSAWMLGKNRQQRKKISAIINNAKGMALMYFTDYSDDTEAQKKKKLGKALEYLKNSDEETPNDWANTCDLASAHWRLSMVEDNPAKAQSFFKKSVELLQRVIHVLRKNYGFAYYELGRIYRTKKEFGQAIAYFDQAMQIEEDYRDVRNKTVLEEKERAEKQDSTLP
jgi:tetratricopeptide (TPR) repeat protein